MPSPASSPPTQIRLLLLNLPAMKRVPTRRPLESRARTPTAAVISRRKRSSRNRWTPTRRRRSSSLFIEQIESSRSTHVEARHRRSSRTPTSHRPTSSSRSPHSSSEFSNSLSDSTRRRYAPRIGFQSSAPYSRCFEAIRAAPACRAANQRFRE